MSRKKSNTSKNIHDLHKHNVRRTLRCDNEDMLMSFYKKDNGLAERNIFVFLAQFSVVLISS